MLTKFEKTAKCRPNHAQCQPSKGQIEENVEQTGENRTFYPPPPFPLFSLGLEDAQF